MGIVIKQSIQNIIILVLSFALGAVNLLYMYTHFLEDSYGGLLIYLAATSGLLLPFVSMAMQHAVIRFYTKYEDKKSLDEFLSLSLLLPLVFIIPFSILFYLTYDKLIEWFANESLLIEKYFYLVLPIAVFMTYFEIFYSWSKARLKSVFGLLIKEMLARLLVFLLIVLLALNIIDLEFFIYSIPVVYLLRMLIMLGYSLSLYRFRLIFKLPSNYKQILKYSFIMMISGSTAVLLLDIDKFMIAKFKMVSYVEYYAIAIYIANIIAMPNRAMTQISNPITAKAMNNKDYKSVADLYKIGSINLLVIGGLLFLLINLNLTDIYSILNKP